MTNARLEELRSKFQENPRRYFAPYANELRKAGDSAQAISVCRTHMATQPGHVSGHIVLGQALYEAGEAQEARDVFTAALELDPENLIALRTLGEISQVKGEFVSARQWYERLLEADPRNGEVAQLLRDLPKENARAATPEPLMQARAAETSLEEHKEQERNPFAPPVTAPTFHSGFTGPGPAYKTAEDLAEEERQASRQAEADLEISPVVPADEPVEFVEMDSMPPEPVTSEAVPEPVAEWTPATQDTQHEPIDMVDFDAFTSETSVAEPVSMAVPDESQEPVAESGDVTDFSFAAPVPEPIDVEQAQPAAEFEIPVDDATEEFEQPRALFAERGFDGPAGDQIGWMMTPSAVESDLESAPEDWFDAPTSEQGQEVAAESPAEEQPVMASEPDHATDSWFDETQGASVVAPTEGISNDEFWLPPDLSQVRTTPVAAGPEPEPEPFAETQAAESFAAESVAAESVAAEPIAEQVTEAPVSETTQFQDHQWMESPPSMESSVEEPEAVETSDFSTIEYFDHSAPVNDVPVDDVHEVAAAAEWSDPHAHVEPETTPQDVRPVAEEEHAEPVPTWEPATAESSFVESSEPVESAPVMESYPESYSAPTEFDSFATASSVPDESGFPEPVVGHSPPMAEASIPSTPEPFVTETLAELYFQQGFRDEALSIYRQLVERDPSNSVLRQRMQAIQQGEHKQPANAVAAGDHSSSQSVRTFFSKLARRPATGSSALGAQPGDGTAQPDVPFASAASALANLFSASKPAAADEGAAASLASAYTNPAGRPSRAADRELSLDHLFRDVPPGGSQTGGMSMDEFYSSPDAAPGSPTEPGDANESPESGGTDIRQFTAWLEGLRKK